MKTHPADTERVRIVLPDSGTMVSAGGLTLLRKGVTLWVPRGGQGAKKIDAALKIGQIEIPLVGEQFKGVRGDGLCPDREG